MDRLSHILECVKQQECQSCSLHCFGVGGFRNQGLGTWKPGGDLVEPLPVAGPHLAGLQHPEHVEPTRKRILLNPRHPHLPHDPIFAGQLYCRISERVHSGTGLCIPYLMTFRTRRYSRLCPKSVLFSGNDRDLSGLFIAFFTSYLWSVTQILVRVWENSDEKPQQFIFPEKNRLLRTKNVKVVLARKRYF